MASKTYAGYGGVFNVTVNSILLAHPVPEANPSQPPPAKTALQYLDISDPAGNIVEQGSIQVNGSIQGQFGRRKLARDPRHGRCE